MMYEELHITVFIYVTISLMLMLLNRQHVNNVVQEAK